ncbi:MAG: acyl-CoA mutase large subunit family protein [Bacteroidetes bacterium]|nr:acyl-CoA mutase large subunit family protein [Bacteroidota bacterium]
MSDIGKSEQYEKLFEEFPVPPKELWKQQVVADLKGLDFEKLEWSTYEGFQVQPMYMREDLDGLPHLGTLPGFDPYIRGINALGHAAEPWKIAQSADMPLVADAAREIVQARENGQNSVALRLDRAAVHACGTADAASQAGVGGTSVQHVADFQVISSKMQPRVDFDLLAGMSSPVYLAMASATERCFSHVDFNPLAHLISEGTLPYSMETTFTLLSDAIRYVDQRSLPSTVISVCGECYHNAGANAVEELACMLASGVEYMHRLTEKGLSPDAVARRIRFNFPVGMSFFMEIAKLRAARMLWARIVDIFGVKDDESRKMHSHVRTSWWHQTKYDPYVNMLRATIESMAGVIGGAESMYTAQFDEVAGVPGEFSKRIARNLQIVLREESQLGQVTDPAAGSYYVETLTDAVARHAWKLFQDIETQGGYLAAVQNGFIQDMIETTAEKKRKNISSRRDVIVGSNQYPNLTEKPLSTPAPDSEKVATAIEASLRAHVTSRTSDPTTLAQSLQKVLHSGSGNLIASMAAALQEGLTVAEVNDVLRNGDTEELHVRPLRPFRAAEGFEKLRDAVTRSERKPRVFLATYGPGNWRHARATFSSGFFGTVGLEVMNNPGFDSPEAAAEAALGSGADVLVACSDDESYPDMLPRMIDTIRAAGSNMIVAVAGYPKDSIDALKAAGVELFIHVRSDVGATLTQLLRRLGVAMENGNEE